jgi:hydrogenase nickel incorporation protein HypA/HybF
MQAAGRNMHELSIALNLVDIAAEEARRHGDVRVTAVHVRLGVRSGVVKEALASAFEVAREAAELREARLVIEDAPAAELELVALEIE